jgi:hypothetical protein
MIKGQTNTGDHTHFIMANIHPVDFADKLTIDDRVREKFIRSYVDSVCESMDIEDIVKAFAEKLWDDTNRDIKDGAADGIVEEAVHFFPDMMTNKFNVISE